MSGPFSKPVSNYVAARSGIQEPRQMRIQLGEADRGPVIKEAEALDVSRLLSIVDL